ncbi:MAG: hypothetical protein ACI92S_001347 [Planctomycetaceae bacterium]|jgi:hypothetical protein
MRTFILLSFVAMITGCQAAQKCTQACRSMSPLPTCKVRDAGNCREQTPNRRPCDLTNARRKVQSSCQKVCKAPPNLGCKKPSIGWKAVKVPVLQLKNRQQNCVADRSCNDRPSCDLGTCHQDPRSGPQACCTTSPGCCREFPTPATEATPFLTVPSPPEAAVPGPQAWQVQNRMRQPNATSTTTNIAQRTQTLEAQVNQIHSMLQQRQATNLPNDGYIDNRGQQYQQKEVIMLPPPSWRTMDGVPPIPNSPIEQTSGYRANSGTYRTAGNPPMWQHSPQNMQRSMLQ